MAKTILQGVLEQLAKRKGDWPSIAKRTGVPVSTLEKIARREIKNPGIEHVQRLVTYFAKHNE